MSKSNFKRVAQNSLQSQAVNEEVKRRLKHKDLMQDYLELQKDYVSKKKNLELAEQKRDILLSEVRFLRQRHRYLMKIQSDGLRQEEDPVLPENSSMRSEVVVEPLRMEKKTKKHIINGKKLGKKKISWEDQVASKI